MKVLALLFVIFAIATAQTRFQYVGPSCQPLAGLPIVTLSRCAAVSGEMSSCGNNKITSDLVNGLMAHREAEQKYEILSEGVNRWFADCKRRVSSYY